MYGIKTAKHGSNFQLIEQQDNFTQFRTTEHLQEAKVASSEHYHSFRPQHQPKFATIVQRRKGPNLVIQSIPTRGSKADLPNQHKQQLQIPLPRDPH